MDYKKLEEKMRPGRLSMVGFLGENESLKEILDSDNQMIKDFSLCHKDVADRIEYFMKTALEEEKKFHSTKYGCDNFWEKRKNGIEIDDKYLVRFTMWKGCQSCPWEDATPENQGYDRYSSIDFTITNTETGEDLYVPGLIAHLIREHGFL